MIVEKQKKKSVKLRGLGTLRWNRVVVVDISHEKLKSKYTSRERIINWFKRFFKRRNKDVGNRSWRI